MKEQTLSNKIHLKMYWLSYDVNCIFNPTSQYQVFLCSWITTQRRLHACWSSSLPLIPTNADTITLPRSLKKSKLPYLSVALRKGSGVCLRNNQKNGCVKQWFDGYWWLLMHVWVWDESRYSRSAPDLTCVIPVHSPLVSIATKHIVGLTAALTADWW